MATKYLDYAGLEHIVGKLYARGFKGMGLSHEDFTAELKAKYDALAAASSVEDLQALFTRVDELEALIDADKDGAINKFNEIVAFLAGITESQTLDGIVGNIATQVADAKKAGTDAASALETYKTVADGKFVAKVSGKGLSTNDYTTAEKNAVATISAKLNAADIAAITTAEIDTIVNA